MPKKKTKAIKEKGKAAPAKAELTALEIFYQKTPETQPQGAKSKPVHEAVFPMLGKIFFEVKGKKEVPIVKLREDFGGSMLTYVVNRMIVAKDVAAFKAACNGAGYKTIDSSENGFTCSKPGLTLVVTMRINNEEKAIIDLTF
ncbi:MAG: hypothetical protein WC449_00795 [Candidatus Paceibacterota bacterium]